MTRDFFHTELYGRFLPGRLQFS